ncbi:hypothetical protein GJ700_28745 [Duganella sp. FT92W]|uniref:Uncharacterized protein n=1 Tax=Pseudoduganella rivuli TaxID=2666085 RepID=A0A7X2ITA5_9BURK|nr:hypothetical protein [Pseudoduganella rivuli]MRV75711.1 hypothetical protein [Pseudoduganella rivuli]
MSYDDEVKMTLMALKFYPPSIQDDLIRRKSCGVDLSEATSNWISFGSDALSFLRKNIFDAIRDLYQKKEQVSISDKSGREWVLVNSDLPTRASIKFQHADINFVVSDCFALHPDPEVRSVIFKTFAFKVGMTKPKRLHWLNLVLARALHDEELSQLLDELATSPGGIDQIILERMKSGEVDYPTLIPDFESYYEDLVGAVGQNEDIFSFSKMVSKRKFDEIIDFERTEGLKKILRQSAHSSLVDSIALNSFQINELEDTFEWLSNNADVLSKIGAVELALTYYNCNLKIAGYAVQMIKSIVDDDLSASGELSQFCDLVFLVGGELARNGLFISSPPYWRRLAIFSHAASINWAVLKNKTNVIHLSETQCHSRKPLFFIQTLIDLRKEPRWQSDYLNPAQLKAEFLGRILMTAQRNSTTLHEYLREYILQSSELKNEVHFPFAYLPGPLEGGMESAVMLPHDLSEAIETALSSLPLELSSFIPLVNSALVFKLNEEQANLAAKALRAANYQLRSANNTDNFAAVLNGLATVAAAARNPALADEIIILMRVQRNCSEQSLSADQALTIGLISAAARSNERDWMDFIGKLLNELSFQDLSQVEARTIRFVLLQLCRLKPDLWRYCGGAHAALQSILPQSI